MKIRTALVAGAVAFGLLSGLGATTAATAIAAPADAASAVSIPLAKNKKPDCQPAGIYEAVLDRNDRWYCKFAPKPGRHNRHDKERRDNR